MGEYRYRHELKFLCTQLQLALLGEQLDCLMEKDKNSGEEGYYTVRSLYFDDYEDTAMRQKEDGMDIRKKYRIRSYESGQDEAFRLEIKHRVKDKIRKESCMLSRDEVQRVLADKSVSEKWGYDVERPVLNRFELERETRILSPAVIVEYDRIPYIYPDGNVRITMDRNICGSIQTERFLEKDISMVPILDVGHHLLEIKYDEYLPDVIREVLQIISLQKTSFSKYYLCRLAERENRER